METNADYHVRSLVIVFFFGPIVGYGFYQSIVCFQGQLDLIGSTFLAVSFVVFVIGAMLLVL